MVNDPLPAGFEIDNPNLMAGSNAALMNLGLETEVAHSEFRNDRFLTALDRMDSPFRLAYMVRAYLARHFPPSGRFGRGHVSPRHDRAHRYRQHHHFRVMRAGPILALAAGLALAAFARDRVDLVDRRHRPAGAQPCHLGQKRWTATATFCGLIPLPMAAGGWR